MSLKEKTEGDLRHRDTQGQSHVKTVAKIGPMSPQAKENLEAREVGRSKEGFSTRVVRGSTTLPTPSEGVQTWGLQNCEGIHFCCFKAWLVVIYYDSHRK